MKPIQPINNGETGGVVRGKINANFEAIALPSVTLAVSTAAGTSIDVATYANRTIKLSVSGTAGQTAQLTLASTGWAAGDTITFHLVELSTAFGVSINAPANTITAGTWTMSSAALFSLGNKLTLTRNDANTAWDITQTLPLFAIGSGGGPWLRGTGDIKATVAGVDHFWGPGYAMTQYSNNATTNLAELKYVAQGTLSTNDVTGIYALTSRTRVSSEIVDYSGAWKIGLGLYTFPHYRSASYFPAGSPTGVVGKRHAALALESTKYTDSKHWGGLLIGSISGASYNGVWAYFDDYGNHIQARGRGTVSEQRDTGTASFTVTDNTAQVSLAGSGTVTVTFPQVPFDGQDLTIFLETAYTAITLSSGAQGAAFIAGTIGATAGSFGTWSYRSAGNVWRRKG